MTHFNGQYKDHIRDWVKSAYKFEYAVSFHFNGRDHEKTMRLFVNELNKAVFRHKVGNYGYTLAYFAVRQRDKKGHHVHISIGGFPRNCNPKPKAAIKRAIKRIKGIWKAFVDVQPITDRKSFEGEYGQNGWVRYSTRELDDNADILVEQGKCTGENPLDKYFSKTDN